ncbi:MAG: extracellular solute-binding protein [Kiritimatiellia bacterium]
MVCRKSGKSRCAIYTRVRALALIGLATLLGMPGLLRAGYVEERDGKTIIHVKLFDLPNPSRTDTFTRAELAAVRAFTERFPEIFRKRYRDRYVANPAKYGRRNWDRVEIVLERFSGIQVEGVEVDLLAIAGGLAPDVLYINFRKSDNYIQSNFLYPLDKPEDGYLTSMTEEEINFRVYPKLWPVIRRKGPDGRVHVWALPYGGAVGRVLLFRKDLFDRNGIPYPTADWTWDDMLAAARKITDPQKGIYGMLLARGKHESWYWMTFLWSAGGEAMIFDEAARTWRCVFDSREAAVALDFYIRLSAEKWVDAQGKVRRGYSSKEISGSAAVAKWNRGEIGMMLEYIDEKVFSTINPELTGMVPVPKGPTGIRGAELNSRMMGLFSGIKDPVVRDAAWEYMRFYESEEAVRIKTQVMVEGGLGQFINPKYLRLFGYSEIERLAPKEWAEIFEIAMATGKPEPYGRNSNVAYDMMTIPIQQAEQLALQDHLPVDPEERLQVLQRLLHEGCARANEKMIGILTARQRLVRRIAAALMLVAIVAVFSTVFRRIVRAFTPPRAVQTATSTPTGRYVLAWVLLLPAVLTIFFWRYVPLVQGSVMAFQDYRLIGKSVWVGLDNFGNVLFDRDWWMSVWNALRYSFLVVSLTFLPPIVLAILLQEVPKGKLLFRSLYYLPAVMTGLVTVVLWKQFYEPSERGVLNAVLLRVPAFGFILAGLVLLGLALLFARRLWRLELRLAASLFALAGLVLLVTCAMPARDLLFPRGEAWWVALRTLPTRLLAVRLEPYRWLSLPDTAMVACVLPMIWAGMGPGSLIYLAALKGIPEEYYEAADIDGATFIEKILFIVFPTIKPLVVINFVGVFIASWYTVAGNILALTGGAANTEVAELHIWYKAFTYLQFGPATAMAWMLGLMLIGFTVQQLRILSRVEFRAQGATK